MPEIFRISVIGFAQKREIVKNILVNCLENISVAGWPLKCGIEDYEKVTRNYIERLPAESIRGVLQIGGVSHPGISDIDLIVVLKQGSKVNVRQLSSKNIGEDDRYLLMHDPWFVDEKVLKNFSLLIPFFACKSVSGNAEIPKNVLYPDLEKEIALISLSDSLLTKIPRELIFHLLVTKTLNARFILVLANSVRHSTRLFVEVSGETWKAADEFNSNIDQLRADALAGEQDEAKLRNIVIESLVLSFDMLERMTVLWNKVATGGALVGQYSGYFNTSINPDWNKEVALNWSLSKLQRVRRSVILPSWAGIYLGLLASEHNMFSKYVSSHYSPGSKVNTEQKMLDAVKYVTEAKSDYIRFGQDRLGYAGSLGITHGCGENIFRSKARSILKVVRAAMRSS